MTIFFFFILFIYLKIFIYFFYTDIIQIYKLFFGNRIIYSSCFSAFDGLIYFFSSRRSGLGTLFSDTLSALDGFNVTIPHKTNIIPLLDKLSPKAELFGSVNTVLIDGEESTGYNTVCTGFLRSLDSAGLELGGKVLILGSGGVARTFAFESVLANSDVTLAVRASGLEKAQRLKDEINERLSLSVGIITLDSVNGAYDLIINATPVGMSPDTEHSPLKKEAVIRSAAAFDAIYNPTETLFLKPTPASIATPLL